MKIPMIYQMENSECGLACCAMILNYFKYEISLNELREIYPSSRSGYSLLSISKVLGDFNISSHAFKASVRDLKPLSFPLICFWESSHFIILEKISKNKFYILDPAKGRQRMSISEFERHYSNIILTFKKLDSFMSRKDNKKSPVLKYFFKYRNKLGILFFVTALLYVIQSLVPIANRYIIDTNFKDDSYSSRMLFTILFIFTVSFSLMYLLRQIYVASLKYIMDKEISYDFMKHLIYLPYSFYEKRTLGDILFRANSIVYIREILSNNFIAAILDLLMIVVYAVVLFSFSKYMVIFLISLSLALSIVMYPIIKISKNLIDKNIKEKVNVQNITSEVISKNSDIKLTGEEEFWINKWDNFNTKQLIIGRKLDIHLSIVSSITNVLQIILPVLTLIVGVNIKTFEQLTLGQIVAISTVSPYFISPIISLSDNYIQLMLLKGYFLRIEDVFNTKSELIPERVSQDIKFDKKIELKDIWYKYGLFDDYVLKGINVTIKKGETVAIVGESGSGKSTLAKILLGLLEPNIGSIEVDGVEKEEIGQTLYRKIFGAVLQNSTLSYGTLRENLTFGHFVSDEELMTNLNSIGLSNVVKSLPLGLETIIAEEGNNFSGGQQQMILLARCLLSKPSVVVLDEATSSLDNLSQQITTSYLSEIGTTKILIAHRLDTIKSADKILVMHNGEIVKIGTHRELLELGGIYKQLYSNN